MKKFDYRTFEQILVDWKRLRLYREKEWLDSGAKEAFLKLNLQKPPVQHYKRRVVWLVGVKYTKRFGSLVRVP